MVLGFDPDCPGHLPPKDAQLVVLELLEDDSIRESLSANRDARDTVHALLWNHALRLAESDKQYELARRAYGAAASLLDGNSEPDAQELVADAHMAQAMCALFSGDAAAAEESLQEVDACRPGLLPTAFLRFKSSLAAKNTAAAVNALSALAIAAGTSADVLRLACCEAMDAGATEVAATALKQLLTRAANDPNFLEDSPVGYEATICQNLIALLADELAAPRATVAQDGADMELEDALAQNKVEDSGPKGPFAHADAAAFKEMAQWVDHLVRRARQLGHSEFFQQATQTNQVEWLAATAWNAGTAAARADQQQACAVLLGCCADLYGMLPAPTTQALCKQHVSETVFLVYSYALVEHSWMAFFAEMNSPDARHRFLARCRSRMLCLLQQCCKSTHAPQSTPTPLIWLRNVSRRQQRWKIPFVLQRRALALKTPRRRCSAASWNSIWH